MNCHSLAKRLFFSLASRVEKRKISAKNNIKLACAEKIESYFNSSSQPHILFSALTDSLYYGKGSINSAKTTSFEIAGRIHTSINNNWQIFGYSQHLSPFTSMLSNNIECIDKDDIYTENIRKNKPKLKSIVKARYMHFKADQQNLKIGLKINPDIEIVKNYDLFALIRVYHLYIKWKHSKGVFPIERFLRSPYTVTEHISLSPFSAEFRNKLR